MLRGSLCASWTWVTVSFLMLGKFSAIISSNVFSGPFSVSSPGNSMRQILVPLMLSHMSLRLSSFYSFFFILFHDSDFYYSVFQFTYLFFFLTRLFIPSSVFFISVIVLFTSVCLFFSSSKSSLNISCVFSIYASILFLRSWIAFTIITLNSFSGRLLISTSLSCFSGVLSCSFIWDIFL